MPRYFFNLAPGQPTDEEGEELSDDASAIEVARQTALEMVRLMDGQYNNPVRIVCFNTAKGTSRDATLEIAREIQDRVSRKGGEISPGLRDFIEWELDRSNRLSQTTSVRA